MGDFTSMRVALVVMVIGVACSGGGMQDLPPVEICDDGVDNDEDGATDCDDEDCLNDPFCIIDEEIVDDAEDLPAPDGDPSLDVDSVTFSLDGDTFSCDLTMHGAWKPSQTYYSYYAGCYAYAIGSATPTVSVITQRHDGVDDVLVTGVPESDVTVTDDPDGPTITIANMPSFDRVHVETGIQKANPGNFVGDQVRTAAGDPIPFGQP